MFSLSLSLSRYNNYDADSDTSSTTSADNSIDDDDEHEADFPPPPPLTNDEIKPQIPHKKWLTEGGYRLVHKPKNNCELKAGTTSSRVFVSSSRQTRDTKKYTLKTVKSTKRDSGKNNKKISVFVSRLDPTFVTVQMMLNVCCFVHFAPICIVPHYGLTLLHLA